LGRNISDAQTIANQRIGGGTAPLAQNGRIKAARVIDDFINRQKKRSVTQFINQFQFAIENASYLRRHSLRETLLNPLFAERDERFMRRRIAFLNFIGVFGLAQLLEREIAAVQKVLRLANSLRSVTKQA